MTNLPEAKLAREAEIALATLAMITDYDCWKTDEEAVNLGTLLARNISKKIESDLQYPGQIRVTVIRETRCVEYAR